MYNKSFFKSNKRKFRGRSNNGDKTKLKKKDSSSDEFMSNALCSDKSVSTEGFKITRLPCYSVLV